MDAFRTRVRTLDPKFGTEREEIARFLGARDLDFDDDIELAVLVDYDGEPAASACLAGSVVKGVAVSVGSEGEGLADLAVSSILTEASRLGRAPLRAYTDPKNIVLFRSMGFVELARAGDDAVLMESDSRTFGRWANDGRAALRIDQIPGGNRIGAVVVNCNPFTLGHRSLIERAAARCDVLLVFVVETDKSSFPADARRRMVVRGTADLANVRVLASGPYIISEATFPTYFLKEKTRATGINARLDLDLFAQRIAPAFRIQVRFVGTEPYCAVTALYNDAMKRLLPPRGIEVVEFPRLEAGGEPISASTVRRALRAGDVEALAALLPPTTVEYLRSPEAASVLERIRAGDSRH